LLGILFVDRGVLSSAQELFKARHYPSVVALVSDALESERDSVPLLLVRARAQMALRRDLDAQADLREIIRLDPACSVAYRMLGELAARRDENDSAAIFFREALRLDPDDQDADVWLAIVQATAKPARMPKGTRAPTPGAFEDDGPTRRFVARAAPDVLTEREVTPLPPPPAVRFAQGSSPELPTFDDMPRPAYVAGAFKIPPPPSTAFERPQPRKEPSSQRGSVPELPGFGEYLVAQGILTRERLRAAQAYQRSMKVQLATAIVTLGLATPQRIEWAAVAHQSQLARGG
jgi:tetratricopeptide (TPR) repeat protein